MLFVLAIGVIVIVACQHYAPRIGLAPPLILLALGVAGSFIPGIEVVTIDPNFILNVILPPLLFSSATSLPTMDIRRDLRAIGALSVGLVIVTAVILGSLIHTLIPAISFPWAIALGALLSPTDAVAVTIARSAGLSPRVITILEGEGLLNDATALVLLSSATAAGMMTDASALEPSHIVGTFAVALIVALVVGWIVGEVGVRILGRIDDLPAHTALSFILPFAASAPAAYFGGSGLVAAVVAGLVISTRGVRVVPAFHRRYAYSSWQTVTLVLENGIFLLMGLQTSSIIRDLNESEYTFPWALLLALIAGATTIIVRAMFVVPLLAWLHRVSAKAQTRADRIQERVRTFEQSLEEISSADTYVVRRRILGSDRKNLVENRLRRRSTQRRRRHAQVADSDVRYYFTEPLGVPEGAVIIWSGMRGAVTLAAAQTLPLETPMRAFLLMVALLVAAGSLVIQGLTLPLLIRFVKPTLASDIDDSAARQRLLNILHCTVKESALSHVSRQDLARPQIEAASEEFKQLKTIVSEEYVPNLADKIRDTSLAENNSAQRRSVEFPEFTREEISILALEIIRAQRLALLDARDDGVFPTTALNLALQHLDNEEIALLVMKESEIIQRALNEETVRA